jgi:VanZ family protein
MIRHWNVFRRLTLLLLVFYWIALFVGTHVPRPTVDLGGFNDKFLHFGAYAGLAFLLAWSLAGFRPTIRVILSVILIVAVYGMLDELTQLLIPARSGELGDWGADIAGCMVGLAAYSITLPCARVVWPKIRPGSATVEAENASRHKAA